MTKLSRYDKGILNKMTNFGIHHNLDLKSISRFWGLIEPPVRISKDSMIFHDFSINAFSYLSGGFFYHTHIGRYTSIAVNAHIGQGNHPMTWLSTHPFQYQASIFSLSKNYEFYNEHVRDFDHNFKAPTEIKPTATFIGNDCWLGTGAYVKNGVRIGDGAVIGARSVVTKDIPPYAVAVGVPAKVIRFRFSDSIVDRLNSVQWWKFAPWQLRHVDFSTINNALDQVELMCDKGIEPYIPKKFEIER